MTNVPTIYKTVARYYDEQSAMSWLHTNFRYQDTIPDVVTSFEAWQTAYMAACAETVKLLDFRVYTALAVRVVEVFPASAITPAEGSVPGNPTEISSYGQFRGEGGIGDAGSSAWKLHGIAEFLVEGSKLKILEPLVAAVYDAAIIWFQQYRPVAGAQVPAVTPPKPFANGNMAGMYARKVGRSFLSIGQQRRYTRTG